MATLHYLGRESTTAEAQALFLAARNAEAVAALGRSGSDEARVLRARCLLRLGDPYAAVETLQRGGIVEQPRERAAEYRALMATSLMRSGRGDDARAHYAIAERIAGPLGGTPMLELAFYHALDAWTRRDLDETARIVARTRGVADVPPQAYARSFDVLRAQLVELDSLAAAGREDYSAQAALLLDAWSTLARAPLEQRDVWVMASLLRNFAPLVWDLHLVAEADFLSQIVDTVPWTAEIASARYVVHRAIAWSVALDGDDLAAFVRFRDCVDLAPTTPWRIASMLDRAYLASEMRQSLIMREEMLRASELARSVVWESVVGEEAKVLLEIAEAYAREDAGLARHWFSRYDRKRAFPPHLLLLAACDRRQTAMEQDAEAAVLAAEGRVADAVANRRKALATWDELHHDWRAARTAVALARLTGASGDDGVARARSTAFRARWLARTARRGSAACRR